MNVVFDLGGVVVRWDPDTLVADLFDDERRRQLARHDFIGHPDWLELDRGTLSREEAVARGASRTGLDRADIAAVLDRLPPSLVVMPETVELMYRLKAAGHALYCLSNMHHTSIDHLEDAYAFWEVFTGAVISCRVNLCKPDAAIYTHLLEHFGLDAGETVFIDDTEVNLTAAAEHGIRGVHFGDARQCEADLAALGCAIPARG